MNAQNQDIVAEFAVESQEHLADIENELLAIEMGGADIDVELVNKVFRSVHSIKGASGFLGFTTVGALAHSLENVLNLLRNRELVPNSALTDVLLKAADALRSLMANLEQSNQADVSEHVEALSRIIKKETAPAVQASVDQNVEFRSGQGVVLEVSQVMLTAQNTIGHRLYTIDLDLIADVDAKNRTPLDLVKDLLTYGELLDSNVSYEGWGGLDGAAPSTIRFSALLGSMIEEPEMLASALGIDTTGVRFASQLIATTQAASVAPPIPEPRPQPLEPVVKPSPVEVDAPPPEPTRTAPTPEAAVVQAPRPAPVAQADSSIRVSVGLLDHLMNLAGELVLGRNQLLQMIITQDRDGLEAVGSRVDQVTSELQEAIMHTRMQPIGSVFSKFPRVVRDLSGKLGKKCELVLEGNEVELDKSLLEAIADPLTHLVRNSVDHGVEAPQARLAARKPESGRVVLKAFHQAGKVNITLSDDGRGLDPVKLKKKAVERGLITPAQERELSDREAIRLIFHPGFSTAEKVTDVSGRGVGMDVVRTNIEKAGGTVEVESVVGVGTVVHVRLPLTLAIIPSLIVRCSGERYAIPQVSISELVRLKAGDTSRSIEKVSGAEVLRLRGNLLPLVRLGKALGLSESDQIEPSACKAINVIVVETGLLRYGLVVDGLHDSEEIVVKPLGSHLKGTPCLAGATILGDGHVALIVDVAGIAGHCRLRSTTEKQSDTAAEAGGKSQAAEKQTVLLFTNHSSEQFGIPMGLISRIERVRVDQLDSVGGQAMLQYKGTSLPLLVLEKHIQAEPRVDQPAVCVVVFRIGQKEVGLIAPTLVDIREIDADLDVVTFREPGVLGSTIVDHRITRLIDMTELVRMAHPEWLAEEIERNVRQRGSRILLAEDSNFFRKQVTDLLETHGYEVVACEDGQLAWEALDRGEAQIDMVVTDIEMPNCDGYELTQRIRGDERFCSLPIVAVTSLAGQEDVERGRQAGVDDYQIKLDRDQLLDCIARRLGHPERNDAREAVAGRMS